MMDASRRNEGATSSQIMLSQCEGIRADPRSNTTYAQWVPNPEIADSHGLGAWSGRSDRSR